MMSGMTMIGACEGVMGSGARGIELYGIKVKIAEMRWKCGWRI